MILETERLYLREMRQTDYEALCLMLQDEDVMVKHYYGIDMPHFIYSSRRI